MAGKSFIKSTFKVIKGVLLALGLLFVIMLVLALTPAPFYMHYALGDDPNGNRDETTFVPDFVVMFGGAGMPSESNLMRLYYTGKIATHYGIPVVIAHPEDSVCQLEMGRLLTQEGIDGTDIHFMTKGTNTRSQALELEKAFPELTGCDLLVVTSPEHIRRTVKCLNKAGFTSVKGIAAREATVDFDLSLKKQELKGNEAIPSVESTNVRYTFWNYFQLEIVCLREYAALTYYKVKGWI
ncbi:MAG: YdcF family protein [Bacteroidales bacterium]|nr:YdcF family protein [Bacteroidales bacterium]